MRKVSLAYTDPRRRVQGETYINIGPEPRSRKIQLGTFLCGLSVHVENREDVNKVYYCSDVNKTLHPVM